MKKKLSFRIAYSLITATFTLGLLLALLTLVDVIAGKDSSVSWNQIRVKVSGCNNGDGWITGILEQSRKMEQYKEYVTNDKGDTIRSESGIRHRMDTIKFFGRENSGVYLDEATVVLPLVYFKKSRNVNYLLLQARVFLLIFLGEFILYQLFLILYDLKKEIFFIQDNIRRMRRIGFAILLIGLLSFKVDGKFGVSSTNELVIPYNSFGIHFYPGNLLTYLAAASLVFVFAWIFNQGAQLKQENDLTV